MTGPSIRIMLTVWLLASSGCMVTADRPSSSTVVQPARANRADYADYAEQAEQADHTDHAGHTDHPARDSHAANETRYAIGRTPSASEIEAWDIDIMPDGAGLPEGSGNVAAGRALYATQCQRCHGEEGRGGPFDQLAGRLAGDAFPFALDPRAKHTIGNYWPYATTVFDYTRRAMPQDRPGSLDNDDVYALTAYLLYLNELVDETATLDRESLPRVVMPARDRFIPDDRRGGPEIR